MSNLEGLNAPPSGLLNPKPKIQSGLERAITHTVAQGGSATASPASQPATPGFSRPHSYRYVFNPGGRALQEHYSTRGRAASRRAKRENVGQWLHQWHQHRDGDGL